MRKLVIGMALASSALASPALARDDSWYIEGDVGGVVVEDMENLISAGTGTLNNKVGYDLGGAIGYDFGGFRLEAETSYRNASAEAFDLSTTSSVSGGTFSGGANALSFMLNGLLDFGADDSLQGFIGAGAGVGRVNADAVNGQTIYVSDSDTGFAYQVLAGIRQPLSKKVDIGLKYRFYNQNNVDLIAPRGTALKSDFRSHSLMLTLGYNFGEEAAPPPPPPLVDAEPENEALSASWAASHRRWLAVPSGRTVDREEPCLGPPCPLPPGCAGSC